MALTSCSTRAAVRALLWDDRGLVDVTVLNYRIIAASCAGFSSGSASQCFQLSSFMRALLSRAQIYVRTDTASIHG